MGRYAQFSPEWYADNRSQPLHNVSIAFIVVQTFFVVLFLIARYIKKALCAADVWFILLGYIWNLVSITATLCKFRAEIPWRMVELFEYEFIWPTQKFALYLMLIAGLGRHMIAVIQTRWDNLVVGLKFLLVQQFAYLFAVALPKLAILYLYLQLFVSPVYRRITYLVGGVVISGVVALSIATFLTCRPLAYNWDKLLPGGRCGDLGLLFKLVSVPNLITDFAILLLPLPVVWKLQMKTSRKIGLTITFMTGSFGTLTAILRLYYFSTAIMPSLRPLLRLIHDSSFYTSLKSHSKFYISRQNSHATGATSTDLTRKASVETEASSPSKGSSIAITREYVIEHVPGLESDHALEELNRRWRNQYT